MRPGREGYRMPAEYEPHKGTIMIWPVRPGSWPYGGRDAKPVFLQIASRLSEGEEVWILAGPDHMEEAAAAVRTIPLPQRDRVRLLSVETDDAWARDIGPTFVRNRGTGKVIGIDWQFNAWGGLADGLYASWEKDNAAASEICRALGYEVYSAQDFVLEGGSVHSDGEGTLLVTEACLLSAGRNPGMTKEQIENRLKETLGAEKVIWLPHGIYLDETNEHVDNICAFTGPAEVVLAWTEDRADPQYEMCMEDLHVLEKETDAKGRPLTIRRLPLPDVPVRVREEELPGFRFEEGEAVRRAGERLAASYVNFYIGNRYVLVPAFGGENGKADQNAADILRPLFAERTVLSVPARAILLGGGNIHCITQQVPVSAVP